MNHMKRSILFVACSIAAFLLYARDLPDDVAERFAPNEYRRHDPLVMALLDSGESFSRESYLAMMRQESPFPGYVYHPANDALREELTGEIIRLHRKDGTLQQTDIRPLIQYEQDINTILHALYRGDCETACRILAEAVTFAAIHFPQRVDGDFLYRKNTNRYERSEFRYLVYIAFILERTEFLERFYRLRPEAFDRAMRTGILASFATSLENMEFIRGIPNYNRDGLLEVAADLPDVRTIIFASELLHETMGRQDYEEQNFDPWTLLDLAATHPDFARVLFSELNYEYSDMLSSLSGDMVRRTDPGARYLSIPLEYWVFALGAPESINAWFILMEGKTSEHNTGSSFALNRNIDNYDRLIPLLGVCYSMEDMFAQAVIHRNHRLLSWLVRDKKMLFSDCTGKKDSFSIQETIPPSALLFGDNPEIIRLVIEAEMPTDTVFKSDPLFWAVNQKYASRLNVLHAGGYTITDIPVEQPLVELAAFVSGKEIMEPLLDGTDTDLSKIFLLAVESDRDDLVRLLHERNYPLPVFSLSDDADNPWALAVKNRSYRTAELWLAAAKPHPYRIETTALPLGLADLFYRHGILDANIAIDTFTVYVKQGLDDDALALVRENEAIKEALRQKPWELLAVAARGSREVLVSKLIESYPGMIPEDPFDQVDVFTSAMEGNLVSLMNLLLEKNPSLVNARDRSGNSLLKIALNLPGAHHVPYLIERGARQD